MHGDKLVHELRNFGKDADSAAKQVVKTGEPVRIRQGNIKFF